MSILERLKPKFWDHHDSSTVQYEQMFNFRDIWKEAVLITSLASLLPVFLLALIDYNVTQRAIESENLLRTARLVSNARRTISSFLEEHKLALDFINRDNTFEVLNNAHRLNSILGNLNQGMGGFADLGVIDSSGNQRAYSGPYPLEGKNYKDQEWFTKVANQGIYISDIFLGYRNIPHLVIAVKHHLPDGSFYMLRATIDMQRLNDLLAGLELTADGDAFIINQEGILQTPSRFYGKVLEKIAIATPEYSSKTQVIEDKSPLQGEPIIIGYAYINDTPFILMVVKQLEKLMEPWHRNRFQLIGFLAISITAIIIVILGVSTYLVNHIYAADQKRIAALHEVEYSNKMASIGRLAAGVAHEINNPLAIINEKAGLIKDLFTFKQQYSKDQKLMGIVDSIISSVERCAVITRRLLSFARHADVTIQTINLESLIREVLSFLGKEADYRCINLMVDVSDDVPQFQSDRGKLQQIFLNLVNNAFAALPDGGNLAITARRKGKTHVSIQIFDNGCGIPQADLDRVFEPFFTTKSKTGGTGLGLSITYNLVHELGGGIEIESEVGKGTTFTVTLPFEFKKVNEDGKV